MTEKTKSGDSQKILISIRSLRRASARDVISGIFNHLERTSDCNICLMQSVENPITTEKIRNAEKSNVAGLFISKAEDAERFSLQLTRRKREIREGLRILPIARSNGTSVIVRAGSKMKDQSEGMLGNGIRGISGNVANANAPLLCRLDIDIVISRSTQKPVARTSPTKRACSSLTLSGILLSPISA